MKRVVLLFAGSLALGCATIEERKQEQEFESLAEAVRREPENLEARLLLGEKLAARGYTLAAVEAWNDGLAAHPAELRFLRRIADLQYSVGLERESIASYEKLLALSAPPTDPEIDYKVGWAALACREDAKAIGAFERYSRARPQDAAGFVGLGLAQLRSAGEPGKEHFLDLALQSLRRAVLLDSKSVEARFDLAIALEKKGQPALAAAEYEAILAAKPGEPAALVHLALLRLEEGRPEAARPLLERAAAAEKDASRKKKLETKLRELGG